MRIASVGFGLGRLHSRPASTADEETHREVIKEIPSEQQADDHLLGDLMRLQAISRLDGEDDATAFFFGSTDTSA
ncbi:hypothetical protein [Stieleria varia]|uniref:Uncharacterized protein n=1 Tax=Stieleria varia TaxID=2528005 RepID=A0A5C6ARE2_9BACT|nr:hypothetical protein [Stieleria varia]TWU02525.1 hypothetical protein Pla52n_35750 [Stieleria varia]